MRHGDLTTIRPETGSVEIREVKATATPGTNAPQAVRISAATTLINQGIAIDPESGRTRRLHRLRLKPEMFMEELEATLEQCREDGYADRRLGSMQH